MSKIVLMLHQKIGEIALFGNLSKIPGTEVYKVPYEKKPQEKTPDGKVPDEKNLQTNEPAQKTTDKKTDEEKKPKFDLGWAKACIKKVFDDNSLTTESIDYIIVEANYDSPGKYKSNDDLLLHILTTFPTSTIIAYSGTPQALAKALQYHPRLQVMDKNNKPVEDIANICACLPPKHDISVATRVYSLAKLRQEIIEGKPRLRSSTLPDASPPTLPRDFETRLRSNTIDSFSPMLALRKEQQAQQKAELKKDEDTETDKLTSSFARMDIKKI